MLDHRRGWCPLELAYSDILGSNLIYPGGTLANYSLPLYFIDTTDPELRRSVWNAPFDRAPPCFRGAPDGAVAWAVERIVRFLRDEQTVAMNNFQAMSPGGVFERHLRERPGLVERATIVDPGPIS
jgi:hypothetical protein